MRRRHFLHATLLLSLAAYLAACTSVPVTGRNQLSLVPDSEILASSFQQYGEFMKQNRLSTDAEQTAMVKRVGQRIQGSVEQFARQQGFADRLKGYAWEFNLIESKEVNAWCMPGGKVVVYTGLLPVTQDETSLAVVMGHEIAHAVAEHGNERVSQGLIAQFGGAALSAALQNKPQQTQQLLMTAFGVGAQYGALLPFSRTQESEADRLGLIFMALAGYDPNAAIPFWERMAAGGGAKPPEFMSTHPSDSRRIANIRKELPEAMGYYQKR